MLDDVKKPNTVGIVFGELYLGYLDGPVAIAGHVIKNANRSAEQKAAIKPEEPHVRRELVGVARNESSPRLLKLGCQQVFSVFRNDDIRAHGMSGSNVYHFLGNDLALVARPSELLEYVLDFYLEEILTSVGLLVSICDETDFVPKLLHSHTTVSRYAYMLTMIILTHCLTCCQQCEAASSDRRRDDGAPGEYGTGIVWSEFHMPTNYRR